MRVTDSRCAFLLGTLVILLGLSGGVMAAGQVNGAGSMPSWTGPRALKSDGIHVRISDVVVPADVPLGSYQRVIRPFPNWTLICDENLGKKQRVCNISQSIVNRENVMLFSWSLAASLGGQPYFILRTPPSVGIGRSIQLDLHDGAPSISVPVQGCDGPVCLAYLRVDVRLRAAIESGLVVHISFMPGASSRRLVVDAPLEGLASALNAI